MKRRSYYLVNRPGVRCAVPLPPLTWWAVVLVEALCAIVVLLVKAALYPIPRLLVLYSGPVAVETEGLRHPDAQRIFCWVALACLGLVALMVWAGGHWGAAYYWAALLPLGLYVWLGFAVYELRPYLDLKLVMYSAFFVLALVLPSKEDEDELRDKSMDAGNIAGIAFIVTLLLGTLWLIAASAVEGALYFLAMLT